MPKPEVAPVAVMAELAGALRERSGEICREFAGTGQMRSLGTDPAEVCMALSQALEGLADPIDPPGNEAVEGGAAEDRLLAYAALRPMVLRQLAAEMGRDLSIDEAITVNRHFDAIMQRHVGGEARRVLQQWQATAEAQAKYMSYLSHDLRGSLNGVILMLEVVRRELAGRNEFAETTSDLLLMRRSILDTVGMMERHLQADRLRRGRAEVHLQDLDLRAVVEEVIASLSQAAREKQMPVEQHGPSQAKAHGDPDLLRLALRSLLDNAIRYGKGRVDVSIDTQGEGWIISVADKGPGTDPVRLGMFLDPIRRMEMRERGMGLTVAQLAAQRMNGKVEGQTAPGQGTTLRLSLPRAAGA